MALPLINDPWAGSKKTVGKLKRTSHAAVLKALGEALRQERASVSKICMRSTHIRRQERILARSPYLSTLHLSFNFRLGRATESDRLLNHEANYSRKLSFINACRHCIWRGYDTDSTFKLNPFLSDGGRKLRTYPTMVWLKTRL